MADGEDDKHPVAVAEAADDRHARVAQVLAAVVSGLTSTPKELSAKHRSNRGAGPTKAGAEVAAAAASPAIQKIRDYQLQVRDLLFVHIECRDTVGYSRQLSCPSRSWYSLILIWFGFALHCLRLAGFATPWLFCFIEYARVYLFD